MATIESGISTDGDSEGGALLYDGFISYSHAADGLLAPRLQSALQRFAKPWWKRRALRVFRDESSLSANPHLWSSITEALDQSAWFVLLLSPDAAQSPWVNQEIEYWVQHKDPSRILPVVTDGTFEWSDGEVSGSAVPDQLRGTFSEEPRWVDLRFAHDEEQLDLKNPRFSAAVADIASALRGVPKDELESEEVKQHRRTIRTAWAAGILVLLLGVAAAVAAVQSSNNARLAQAEAERADANAEAEAEARLEAEAQQKQAEANARDAENNAVLAGENEQLAESRGLASSAISVLVDDPELSTLLALRAIDQTPAGREPPLEAVNAIWRAASSNLLVDVYDSEAFTTLDLSADGTRLAAVVGPRELQMLDAATGEILWSYSEETVDYFDFIDISVDGRVALGILDSSSRLVPNPLETDATDDLPNRIVILDAGDGSLIQTLTYGDCLDATVPEWSPDGRFVAISSGVNRLGSNTSGCDRGDGPHWVEVVDTANWDVAALLQSETAEGPIARWDETGALHLLTPQEPIQSFEPLTFDRRPASGASGQGDVSSDGASYLTGASNAAIGTFASVYLVDAQTGATLDILHNEGDVTDGPGATRFSPDRSLAMVGTRSRHTYIYDLPSNKLAHKLAAGPILSIAYDQHTGRLYTSGDEPGIKVWDLEGSSVSIDPTIDLGEFAHVNGNSFTVGPDAVAMDTIKFGPRGLTWKVRLFDPATGELVAESPEGIRGPQPLPDGRWAVSFNSPDLPMIWDPETGETVQLITCEVTGEEEDGYKVCVGENEPPYFVLAVPPDGDRILVYGFDFDGSGLTGHFRAFDPTTGALVASADPGEDPGPADQYARRPTEDLHPQPLAQGDGWVMVRTNGGNLAYDPTNGDILYEGGFGVAQHLDLIAVTDGRAVTIIDTSSDGPWTEIATINTDDRVRGLAFNPDGSKLAIGDASALYVVDTPTWQVVQQVKMPSVSDIHWIDDETVVVGTATGLFGTVSLSTERLLSETRAGLLRSFTEQECVTYRIDPCPTLDDVKDG
jgi:WD40 repeat protein